MFNGERHPSVLILKAAENYKRSLCVGAKVVWLHGEEPGEVCRVVARAGVRPARWANSHLCLRDAALAAVQLTCCDISHHLSSNQAGC